MKTVSFGRKSPYRYLLIFFSLSFFSNPLFSQEVEKPDEIFTKPDPDFEVINIPDKWKNESAVILCQNMVYSFDKKGGKIIDKEIIRKRIKLLDKAAITEFSEFYFVSTNNIGINIIKPDGSVNKISLSEAVVVSEEINIPFIYRSNFRIKREYKKIAIPGLEINDIIDYYYNFEDKRSIPLSGEYVFPEILISLNNTYPTLKQKIEFQVEKGFNINFKNQNGAPDLKEKPGTLPELKTFYFEDTNREKSAYERWSYRFRNTPTIKFQIVYIKNGDKSSYFIGEPGVPKKTLTDQEVLNKVHKTVFAKNSFSERYKVKLVAVLKNYRSNKKVKVVPPETTAKLAYYLYRHFRYYNNEGLDLAKIANNDGEDVLFVKTMTQVLKKYKVNFKIILVPPSEVTDLADVILKEELLWMIKVEEGSKPLYFYPPSLHTMINDIDESYAGANAYQINVDFDIKKSAISKTTLPKYEAAKNTQATILTVELDSTDFNKLNISRKFSAHGNMRNYYNYMMYLGDILYKEILQYQSSLYYYYYSLNTYEGDKKAEEEYTDKIKEKLKGEIEGEFDLVKYGEFSLDRYGRGNHSNADSIPSEDLTPLEFSDDFVLEGLLKKAGSNYIFEIGKLLGGQVEIEEKEMKERKFDIYYTPRTYATEILFKIPDGYYIDGIDKLNKNVSNETGHFISSVTIENNLLSIKVEKRYNNHFEKKENWEKLVSFLNAAYDFTQTKILLKKKP